MDQSFYLANRKNVATAMNDESLLILFSGESVPKSADELYPYSVNRNFYYLTGLDKERMILLMEKRNGVVSEKIYVEEVDPDVEKWNGKMLTAADVREISGIETIEYVSHFYRQLERQLFHNPVGFVHLDLEQRGWHTPLSLSHSFAKELTQRHPEIQVSNIYPVICELRTQKSPAEVDLIRTAMSITTEGFQEMFRGAHVGVVEYELEAHFGFALRLAGAKMAYNPIIGAGLNATVMHYLDNNKSCEENELILADVGAEYKYYKADITRTFPASGKFTDRQREIYDIVLQAELETIDAVRPGIPHISLNETTQRILAAGLKRIGLIGNDDELAKYYFYNVSHYLGLDTHDVGSYDVLKPGMILTVEPGIYIPEESLGIRIEDNVLVTETGYEVLSKDLIRTANEIEDFMASN